MAKGSLADLRRKAALPVAISVASAAGQKAALFAALPMATGGCTWTLRRTTS
jgi:hypothetical protein